MIKIANTQFWVHDQDEALAFYTKKLGWEVRADVTMEAWSDPSGNNIRLTQVLEFDPGRV